MNSRQLVELAASVATSADTLLRAPPAVSAESLEGYWVASKVRLDRWTRSLKQFTDAIQQDAFSSSAWPQARGVLDEILVGEILTRVWGAYLCLHDRRWQDDRGEPVARSVLVAHSEARRRALLLLVRSSRVPGDEALGMNRLRRRCESWIDWFVGRLIGLGDVSDWAINRQHALELAEDLSTLPQGSADAAWQMLLASLRLAFRAGYYESDANHDVNGRLAQAVLMSLPSESFDATGLMRPAWLSRLATITDDSRVLIDEYLALEHTAIAAPVKNPPLPPGGRYRFGGEG